MSDDKELDAMVAFWKDRINDAGDRNDAFDEDEAPGAETPSTPDWGDWKKLHDRIDAIEEHLGLGRYGGDQS